jgi:hypothetical protein
VQRQHDNVLLGVVCNTSNAANDVTLTGITCKLSERRYNRRSRVRDAQRGIKWKAENCSYIAISHICVRFDESWDGENRVVHSRQGTSCMTHSKARDGLGLPHYSVRVMPGRECLGITPNTAGSDAYWEWSLKSTERWIYIHRCPNHKIYYFTVAKRWQLVRTATFHPISYNWDHWVHRPSNYTWPLAKVYIYKWPCVHEHTNLSISLPP